MPLGAIAQVMPFFLSVGQCSVPNSSMDVTPNCLATWQVRSASHISPDTLKHQNTIDCLIRPLTTAESSAARQVEPTAAAAPANAVAWPRK